MVSRRHIGAVLAVSVVLLAWTVHAQTENGTARPPSVQVRVEPSRVQLEAGQPAELTVWVAPPPGNHAYLDKGKDGALSPVEIGFTALENVGILARAVSGPRGEWDDQFHATVFRQEGAFKYQLKASPSAKVGDGEYEIKVRSQICNDATGTCYFPETRTLRIQVHVLSVPQGAARLADSSTAADVSASRDGETIAVDSLAQLPAYRPRTGRPERGIVVWMLLAFLAGVILNFMPCVLPVVSIKVLSFVQQAGESRRRVFLLGLAFAAGIIAVFLALALMAILFGLGWGEQFQSQVFLVVMIAVVFAFALALFGVYEVGVPSGVGGLAANAMREGLGGAFLKGALATVLATPCSGPFLGSTLAWTLAQPPSIVLLVFGMLGMGMAFPYLVLTANPALLKLVPRPGPWMETFKHAMGFVLLATVVYLMISLDQKLILYTVALLVFVAMGAWIWGRFSLRPASAGGRIAVLAMALLVVTSGAWFSFRTLRGMFTASALSSGDSVRWEPFDAVRLRQYHSEARNVFLDFSADWCPNCKFNEIRVYNSGPIRRLLQEKNAVTVKADLTREGPETITIRRLMERLGARSIPFLAVFPGDRPLEPYTLYDLVGRESVSKVLKSLPEDS